MLGLLQLKPCVYKGRRVFSVFLQSVFLSVYFYKAGASTVMIQLLLVQCCPSQAAAVGV